MFAEFFSQNIIWFGALTGSGILVAYSFIQGQVKGAKMVSALELPQLQRGGKWVIIDVNEEKDFSISHIPDAENFPLASIDANNNGLLKHKSKTTIVVCHSGTKSVKAAKALVSLGFEDVHILRGGLLSWTKENLPVAAG